eukprot:TRINITY_DN2624_c0_g1_i4.p1 TRINITY_DN2624_c0_g1~~TRINITY_DN2624_c0_g1_i4.p1  ORF type:complete len:501 (-),score=129.29 TRINITY_DN2624_c0_g1_i4:561-2063(-)
MASPATDATTAESPKYSPENLNPHFNYPWAPNKNDLKCTYKFLHFKDILRAIVTYIPIIAAIRYYVDTLPTEDVEFYKAFALDNQQSLLIAAALVFLILFYRWASAPRDVYLLNFSVLHGIGDEHKVPKKRFIEHTIGVNRFDKDALDFQFRTLDRNGVGEETYFPKAVTRVPAVINMETAREEAEYVMFPIVEDALKRCGLKPKDIGVLIVNCSLFNPTPSLCAMIINHFGMRKDITSYNLSGMGCSAGLIAIALAQEQLQLKPNQYALVVSTENITQNWYLGNDRAMLLSNTLFRVGGAAIILTNRPMDKYRAKYRLNHLVRINMGFDRTSYEAVYQVEDNCFVRGVRLSKDLMKVAAKGINENMSKMGPKILPWTEQLKFAFSMVKKMINKASPLYTPNFKKAVDYFCIHAGGRAVIDTIEKELSLTERDTEPSRATLYRFGNTSSSSIWYELNYVEKAFQPRRGEKVWQIAFGSGFKCNSAVWEVLKDYNYVPLKQ